VISLILLIPKIDSVLNEIKTLKAENSKITLENMKLNNEIDSLKIKFDELENIISVIVLKLKAYQKL